jgi:hypothetical protein
VPPKRYCIGGKLDGTIIQAPGIYYSVREELEWDVVGFHPPLHTIHHYYLMGYKQGPGGHLVHFWVAVGLPIDIVKEKTEPLFNEAAVLQDECESHT